MNGQTASARIFGYDDASGRNWINLDHVVKARYDKAKQIVEVFLGVGSDNKTYDRLELRGEVAAALAKALILLETRPPEVRKA